MSWNYRVIKHETLTEDFYAVHEVYYEKEGLPKVSWTTDPKGPSGDNQQDFVHGLRLFLAAFAKPILVVKEGKIVGEEEWS